MNDIRHVEPSTGGWPTAYTELCASYRAIDDFRARMLGLLPLVSGAAITLLSTGEIATESPGALLPIGLFGFFVTAGLLAYEIFGVRRCHALILAGAEIEGHLGFKGQFTTRPDAVAGIVNEPFAAAIIYPAVLGSWIYVAVASSNREWSMAIALIVFGLLMTAIQCWAVWLRGHGSLKHSLVVDSGEAVESYSISG